MLDWLHRMKQTPGAIERFWRVVLVSALDEELARTDARYGIEVFWKAFLGSRGGYRLGIPSVPLGDLYEGCRAAIVRRGGDVRFALRGSRDSRAGGSDFDARFSTMAPSSRLMLVSPPCRTMTLLKLVPQEMGAEGGPLAGLRHIKTSPITGVHLWFNRTVMDGAIPGAARPHDPMDL